MNKPGPIPEVKGCVQPAIDIRGLCKAYKVYEKPFDFLKEAVTGRNYHRLKPVLRDVNIQIDEGEVVGIIGRNGAGKSTLLRTIAGTLTPTSGAINIQGRISAILELGTGFNPAFSGKENVRMSAMMRGLDRHEIEARFDDIVEFAGLGDVINEPFHTYSSGMQARLAFATSVAVDADVLIIDEALAAGDVKFAAKCLGRIREICKSGVTALFVSHVSYHVMQLCSRAIWIEDGVVRMDGEPVDVVRAYEYMMHEEMSADRSASIELPVESAAIPVDSPETLLEAPFQEELVHEKQIEEVQVEEARVEEEPIEPETIPTEPANEIQSIGVELAPVEIAAANVETAPSNFALPPSVLDGEASRSTSKEKFTSGKYGITAVSFLDSNDNDTRIFKFGESFRIRVEYECLLETLPDVSCGLAVAFNRKTDFEAVMYFNTNYPHSDKELKNYSAEDFRKPRVRRGVIDGLVEPLQLKPGEYYVSFGILPNDPGPHEFYEYLHCQHVVSVLPDGFEEPAVFYPIVRWSHNSHETT